MKAPSFSTGPAAKTVVVGYLVLSACAGGTPDGKPAPFEPSAVVDKRVLTGPEGVRVRLAQTEDAALVELERVNERLDGMAFLAELDGSTTERRYLTQLDGRTSTLLVRKNRSWALWIGGVVDLDVDEAASEALNPEELIKNHVSQRAQGTLATLAAFDEERAKSRAREALTEAVQGLESECGFAPENAIDFSAISQESLMKYSIASYCQAPLSAIKRACEIPELKEHLAERLKRFECQFGEAPALEMAADALRFTVDFETSNQTQWGYAAFDKVAFDASHTLGDIRIENGTAVCRSEDQRRTVVVGPSEHPATRGVSYGRDSVLYRQPERPYLSNGWFFEPRYPNPRHNSSFRGYDLRVYSYVGIDDDDLCTLHCGTREIELKPLTGEEKRAFLGSVTFKPLPNPRQAYALARDKRGLYYYVDRGATAETEKDFRLYMGPQGRLRLLKMRDIVSDSEGEIFASQRGRLKLFLGKNDAEWQSRRGTRKLVRVDVQENLPLIYNRLGVYLGKPLHTPCDDL